VFTFREDWHQHDRAEPLVRQYQLTLNAALRRRPKLWDCAVRCCHCGIRFFTHPRNRGRRDLRCPFGCRECHARERGNERSRKHYQTAEGRKHKKHLNGQRSKSAKDAQDTSPREGDAPPSPGGQPGLEKPADPPSVHGSCPEWVSEPAGPETTPRAPSGKATPPKNATFSWEGVLLDERTLGNSRVLPYVLMVASVLEGRTIHREELLAALRKSVRQRSIGRRPRREYVLRFLQQHPP
jgi:hypothetical protein